MAKFNMMDLLNNNSKGDVKENIENTHRFKTSQININDLIPSANNFYSTDEEGLTDLKDSIELLGLQQNLVIKKIENGKYEIIAGHRRYLAMKKLYEEGNINFEYIPCKVEEEDHLKNELRLLMTNSTARELTDWEKIHQAKKLKELLIEYKKREKLPGRVRDIVANVLNTSTSQIARMESISNNLVKEFQEAMKEEDVKISVAYEISKLPEEKQKELSEEHEEKSTITIKTVKSKAKEEEVIEGPEVLDGQIAVEETLDIDPEEFEVKNEIINDGNITMVIDPSTGEVLEEKVRQKYRNKLFIDLENANLNDGVRYKTLDLIQEYSDISTKYKNSDLYINFVSNSVHENDIEIIMSREGIEIKTVDYFDLIEIYEKVILIAH